MRSGISLANKCQLLFGLAIVVIVSCALSVPWFRTASLVRNTQWEVARQVTQAWLQQRLQLQSAEPVTSSAASAANDSAAAAPDLRITLFPIEQIEQSAEAQQFLTAALRRFREDPDRIEHTAISSIGGRQVYRYARVVRESQMRQRAPEKRATEVTAPEQTAPEQPEAGEATADGGSAETQQIETAAPPPATTPLAEAGDPIRAILVVDRTSPVAEGQLLTNRVFIITAGIVGSLLAGLVFHLILTKLILSPVRSLRSTTEKVQSGDLRIRSQIKTGDEFEQLSEAFNSMLERLEQGQAQLRALNESLDLKLMELSEANVGLYESNRFKSEFLANISHELRTPLNSIIGFAELLEEIARSDAQANPKRLRYITNILTSGRSLLEMINELLDMAKIEAGRMEVSIEPTSTGDLIEGLVGIMRPQAEAKNIELRTVIGQRLPAIETDPGKLQQIIYNFLSNAIKFTPEGGTVTVSADRVTRQDNSLGVRLAVSDTGPGIPYDMQDVIFEKFRQIDASHTRQHAGTGLGLAICKELAQMLGATVSFVSEPGRGATFFVDLPLTHQPAAPQPLMAG